MEKEEALLFEECEKEGCNEKATVVSNINPPQSLCEKHATERTSKFINTVVGLGGFV